MSSKTYSELIRIPSYNDRFEYLKLNGFVGSETFGFDRYLNQALYNSLEWRRIRRQIIIRDNGCDLASEGFPINGRIIIHHINPVTYENLVDGHPLVFDPENLVCCSHITHNAIHYGDAKLLASEPINRFANDTCPWKRK